MSDVASRWAAVNALFDRVADLPPDEQAGALAAYDGPAGVRDEVAALLEAMASGPVLPDTGAVLGIVQDRLAAADLTGRRVGPWTVVREVGRGGMGAVYEAYRAGDTFQQRVAIKTLGRHVDRDGVVRRFHQERRILASLEHPNIARLVDGGETDGGLPYLVMEYVDGVPIDRYCDERRLGVRERIDLFRQVCLAVQFAHRNLVVHRDLKPSNVLVTTDGTVKLLDFGIAKVLEHSGGHGESITETGLRAFTTGYASPEQVRGQPISTSTDVYSLGVVFYQLLTGRLPVEVADTSPTEAMRRICDVIPPAPSRAGTDGAARQRGLPGAGQLARTLGGELDDIALMALRKEPERRYVTVAAFSDDLKRYLQGHQVLARPDTWRYRVRTLARRNPRFVLSMGIAAASLVVGSTVAAWQARRALLERDRAQVESERSANVVSFLEQMLTTPTQATLTEATISLLDQAVDHAAAELADDPLARAGVYRTAANAFVIHYRRDRAQSLLDSALALDRAHAGERSPEVARDLTVLARLVYTRGQYDSAAVYATRAVNFLRERPSNRPLDYPTALQYQAFALMYMGRGREADSSIREAIAIERQRPGSTLLPYLYTAFAEAQLVLGAPAAAAESYRTALVLFDSLPVPDPAERGITEMAFSRLLAFDSLAGARRHAERAVEIFERRWGPRHYYTANARATLARLRLLGGDTSGVMADIERSIEVTREAGVGSLEQTPVSFERFVVLGRLGRWKEADEVIGGIGEALRRDLGDRSILLASVEQATADAAFAQRDLPRAAAAYESAFQRYRAEQVETSPSVILMARSAVATFGLMGEAAPAQRFVEALTADTVRAILRRMAARRGDG